MMFMEERQADIVKRVNETGRIMVSEIQQIYNVSSDCARRDLRSLEGKGVLQRTHGGAISITKTGIYPDKNYNPKDVEEIKKDYFTVAQKALEYVRNNDVIYVTPSLVGYYMAMNLPEELTVTILTNSVTIAEVLRRKENVTVIFLGGIMSNKGNCHDFYTIQMVNNIRIDKAFMSHNALSLEYGATTHDPSGMEFGRAVMHNSKVKIGLYPSSKIGKESIHSVCPLDAYDLIVTDSNAPEMFVSQVTENDVNIEVVSLMQ